jgi:hypothetical protein
VRDATPVPDRSQPQIFGDMNSYQKDGKGYAVTVKEPSFADRTMSEYPGRCISMLPGNALISGMSAHHSRPPRHQIDWFRALHPMSAVKPAAAPDGYVRTEGRDADHKELPV